MLDAILAEARPAPGRPDPRDRPGPRLPDGRRCSTRGAAVTAVELDRGLAAFLRERFDWPIERGSLRLIEGDALDQDLVHLVEPPYDVVANLPYHITSPILHALLGAPPRPERLVLMVQREVAERIAAPPGKMSYLSVFVQYHARVRIAFHVPATAFEPEPAVESAVIVVEPYDADDRLDPATEDELWRLVQAALPRAAQDDPQRPVPPAAGRRRAGRRRRWRPPASTPIAGRRPSRWGSGWRCARRSGRSARTGAAAASGERLDDRARRTRPDPPADPGRPPRAGQAQPDARRRRAGATTASTPSTRSSCRSPSPTG